MAYFYRSEILDSLQKKKEQDKDSPQSTGFQQQLAKPGDKQLLGSEVQNVNVPVSQHVPPQLLSPSHGAGTPIQKEDPKDKALKVTNSTTITLIENGNLNGDKDKDNTYPKNYYTLEPKNDKKDETNKNSITITRTVPKQSPGGGQIEKPKGPPKPAKRPLQCLETLAEKAGITFEDKYEAANTLLALDKQNNSFRRPDIKPTKPEPENQSEEYRYRSQKEEDDKLQIQQQIIQQQQQQQQQFQQLQQQQLQQLQQQQLQQLQQQALQRQHHAIQQHIRNQQDQQELLQKQYQQQQQQQQQQHQSQQQQQQQTQQHQQQQTQQQQTQQHQQQQTQQHQQQQTQQHQQQQTQQHQQQQTQQHQQQQTQQQQQQQQHQKSEIQQLPQQQELQQKFVQVVNNQPVHTQQFNVPGIGEINLSFLASPQSNVNLLYDKNQKTSLNTEIKPQQQLVDGQSQVVQQQMSMSQHDPTPQHHQTVTVVSSMPSTMTQHQVAQQGTAGGIPQQAGAGITTMPTLQALPPNTQHPSQISADWGHGRVQVIQQPIQNNTYLQQLYNAQGPLLMPGNIALHPGINSQQIQVIAAGKPFQGNQLAPHMITQGKQVLQGQAAPFPGYTTIPAIPTTQNQTFVFSPLGVINPQPNILPAHSQSPASGIGQQQKPQEMHKVIGGGKVSGGKVGGGGQAVPVQAQCVQVSQPVLSQQPQTQIISPLQTGGQPMQFAPWQISGALPQVWATGGLPAGTIPAGGLLAPNPIFIRGTQPDTTPSMFIQHSPQNNVQHNSVSVACSTTTTAKPRASSEALAKAPRPLTNILPSTSIRPASSVSTQTNANTQNQKQRGKIGIRSPAPTTKQDAANQTNKVPLQQPKQQLVVNSSSQVGPMTSGPDKQPTTKNAQQQSIMQQQQQQQQQQRQPQDQQQYQSVQSSNYNPQGYMATLGIGAPLAPTITMVHTPTLVGGNLVQTTVSMAVQPQTMTHTTAPMQTVTANNMSSPSLSLHPQGGMGLLAAPPVLPLQTVSHLKTDEERLPPAKTLNLPSLEIEVLSGLESPPMPAVITTADAAISTTTCSVGSPTPPDLAKVYPSKLDSSTTTNEVTTTITTTTATTTAAASSSPPSTSGASPSSSQVSRPAPLTPESTGKSKDKIKPKKTSKGQRESRCGESRDRAVVTTVASSTSSSSTMTSAITAPVSSGGSMFKSSHSAHRMERHIGQQATHDKGLPKAMVKPNILTHVIEGYVIQEAAEPFAVNRPMREWMADKEQDKENKLPSAEEPPRKKANIEMATSTRISSSNEVVAVTTPALPCSKPEASAAEIMDTATAEPPHAKLPNANKWTVSEVCDFIRNIPGCAGYADEFLIQEVDGEALLLIRPEHLVMALSMKLGPALKIVACIDSLRPEGEKSSDFD